MNAAARTLAPLLLMAAAQLHAAPEPASCPQGVPEGTRCFNGRDTEGAYYWIAVPADWNKVLVVHAHGGPELGPPELSRSTEDLQRWAITLKAGYAWAGSTYRRGGYGVTMAAEDTERLRKVFVASFGPPRRTLLHGQSYGAGVAAKAVEMYGPASYDGALLTSGVLGGGERAYSFRLDLRVVYQYYCKNHPRPDEPQYPLWQGLPADSAMTRAELSRRVDECTGLQKPAAQRTEQQKANLAAITNVIGIKEGALLGHLSWATWLFQDLVQKRIGGGNPFDNTRSRYRSSPDDAALNTGVLRYAADPAAVRALNEDSRPAGQLTLPVLTFRASGDPTAFVELATEYQGIVNAAGKSGLLVQAFSDETAHSYLGDPEYTALFDALLAWVDKGEKPSAQGLARACRTMEVRYGPGCRFTPDYASAPLDTRLPAPTWP